MRNNELIGLKSNTLSNACSREVTQEFGQRERDGKAPSLYCYGDMVLWGFLFIVGFTGQKFLNIAFFELKLSVSFQIGWLLYWFNLTPVYKGIESCATNVQSAQDLSCAQQFIVTHNSKPSFCTSWTKRTFLTSYLYKMYNTNIVHDKIKFDKAQKKSTDRSQCPEFSSMSKLLRLDWYPVAIALDQYALLLLYLTCNHVASQAQKHQRERMSR